MVYLLAVTSVLYKIMNKNNRKLQFSGLKLFRPKMAMSLHRVTV